MRSLLVLAVLTSSAHAQLFKPLDEPNIIYRPSTSYIPGYYELHHSMGGLILSFNNKFREIETTGALVRVKETCGSACTLILRNPRACAEQLAIFGFHQAMKPSSNIPGTYEYAERATNFVWDTYPSIVKAKLGRLTPQMVWIAGVDIMPLCPR